MERLSTDQLRRMRDAQEDIAVINVLDAEHYEKEHIPDSRNIPVDATDFVSRVEDAVGRKSRQVVVYCASTECDASSRAAGRLEQAGFSHVLDFAGGMKAWREANLPVEGRSIGGR